MVVDTFIRDALEDLKLELGLLELFQEASFVFVVFNLLRLDFPEVRLGIEADDGGDTPAAHRPADEPPEGVTPAFMGDFGGDTAHHHADEYIKFERHGSVCQLNGPHDAPG
jgi:hypothetical protein